MVAIVITSSITSSTSLTSTSHLLLPVLYKNDHIAVVAKPPSIPCHRLEIKTKGKNRCRGRGPGRVGTRTEEVGGSETDTDTDTILERARATFPEHNKIHLVHRLDSPTSGCLLLAFSPEATKIASRVFRNKTFTTKTYYALCRGDGVALREKSPLVATGDVKDLKGIMRQAESNIIGLWGSNNIGPETQARRCCLVCVRPQTGRYHQIRQHLGRENYPLIGETQHHKDIKENKEWKKIILQNEQLEIEQLRPMLHCYQIKININDEKEEDEEDNDVEIGLRDIFENGCLDVTCPLPSDMQSIIDLADWAPDARNALPGLFEPFPTTTTFDHKDLTYLESSFEQPE